jgi:hypothetical protein
MVTVELGKRDFVWMGFVAVLIGVGFVYGYGGSDPAVMGHSSGEVVVDWNDIVGMPAGFADGVDDVGEGGGAGCSYNESSYKHNEVIETGYDEVMSGAYCSGRTYYNRPYVKTCKNGYVDKEYTDEWGVKNCLAPYDPYSNNCGSATLSPGTSGSYRRCASCGYGTVGVSCPSSGTPSDPDSAYEVVD